MDVGGRGVAVDVGGRGVAEAGAEELFGSGKLKKKHVTAKKPIPINRRRNAAMAKRVFDPQRVR